MSNEYMTGTGRLSRDGVVQILCRTVLFAGLSTAQVGSIAACAVQKTRASGQVLYVLGDEPNGIYVISSGSVRTVRHTNDGREQILSVEYPFATLSEVAVFDGGKCLTTAITQEDSDLLFISSEDIHRLCNESPAIMANIVAVLARRVRSYAELIHTLSLRDVDRRVAWFLLQEALHRGVSTSTGTAVEMLATHHEIAARVGCVREMVTRALSHLHKAGLIVADGRLVVIPNQAELMKYVGS